MLEGYCKVFKNKRLEPQHCSAEDEVDDNGKPPVPTGRCFPNKQSLDCLLSYCGSILVFWCGLRI